MTASGRLGPLSKDVVGRCLSLCALALSTCHAWAAPATVSASGPDQGCALRHQALSAAPGSPLAEGALRFLATTTTVSKALLSRQAFDRLPGVRITFEPGLPVLLHQPWMREPTPLTVRELLVESVARPRVWLLRAEGQVMEVGGGQPSTLVQGLEQVLCQAGAGQTAPVLPPRTGA